MLRLSVLSALVAVTFTGATFAADSAPKAPDVSAVRVNSGAPINARRALGMTLGELHVDNVAVVKVIDYLRTTSGANIVVNWKALEAAGVSRDAPVSLEVRGLTLRKALQLVLDQASPAAPLTYNVDQNVISITTQDEADKIMITKVYIVDDLVMPDMAPMDPPTFNLQAVTQGSGGGSGGGGGGSQGSIFQTNGNQQLTTNTQSSDTKGQDLVSLIREIVRPTIWKENGGPAAMRYFNGKLIVTAPQSVHEMIGGDVTSDTGAIRVGM
jgi:hypothetical protein